MAKIPIQLSQLLDPELLSDILFRLKSVPGSYHFSKAEVSILILNPQKA